MYECIDVSRHQGVIDWSRVQVPAIIRCGYRGYGNGALRADEQWTANRAGAAKYNLFLGVYFFSQAVSEAEGREEAEFVHGLLGGADTVLPVYIDLEWANETHTGRADRLTRAERTAVAVAFCERIKELGHKPGFYTFTAFATHPNGVDYEALAARGYSPWLADTRVNYNKTLPRDIHQYTQMGHEGFRGAIDTNRVYLDEEEPMEFKDVAGKVLVVTSAKPACEVFSAPDTEAVLGKLGEGTLHDIKAEGGTVELAGMTGVWYRIELGGADAYVLALPDRCVVKDAEGEPAQKPEEGGVQVVGAGRLADLLRALAAYLEG